MKTNLRKIYLLVDQLTLVFLSCSVMINFCNFLIHLEFEDSLTDANSAVGISLVDRGNRTEDAVEDAVVLAVGSLSLSLSTSINQSLPNYLLPKYHITSTGKCHCVVNYLCCGQ